MKVIIKTIPYVALTLFLTMFWLAVFLVAFVYTAQAQPVTSVKDYRGNTIPALQGISPVDQARWYGEVLDDGGLDFSKDEFNARPTMCHEHYLACIYHRAFQETVAPGCPLPGKCVMPAPKPKCTQSGIFSDGLGNRLWKPKSDNTGNPVILLNKQWCGRINRVELYKANQRLLVATSRIDGKSRPCGPNGGRAHYDIPRRASGIPSPVILRIVFDAGNTLCLDVGNPTQRHD